MASILQLTEEERNFTRFFFLNFKVSPDIARRFFDGVFPPIHLAQTINNSMKVIIDLNTKNKINAAQLEILRGVRGTVWPPSLPPMPVGTKHTSSKDFDLTLMICLLRNLGGLSKPSNGWDQLPPPNDISPGAHLATLKWYRNQLAHTTVTSMDNNEFRDKWTRVEKALTSLNSGQRPHEVTKILQYDLNGEQAKTLANSELKQLKKDYENEKEQIESELSYYREGNLPKNIADANVILVETWKKDDESFYDTTGSNCVYDKVKDFNCILVTSSSGLGKTATIRHIALKLQSEGFEIVSIEYPEDIMKYKTIKKQVFLIDDVLGKYDLSPTLLEQWERNNEKLISCLGTELGSHKLLCTLRLQIALNKRFKNASTILNKEVINLEDESYTLSKEEKQQILIKHLTTNNLEKEIKTEDVKIMCKTNYAFPLLCKLVSTDKERFRKRIDFFTQPLPLFREELNKMSNENEKLYCILVICMLYSGSFSRSIFDNGHDEKINRIMQTCGLQRNMSMKVLEDSAVSAVGSYLTDDSTNFQFIHDALEESIGYHFYKFNPRVMLTYCDIFFIRDRIRIHSNENKNENVEENIVIIREDELNEDHLQPLYKRLWNELTDGRFSSLLMSNLFKNERFVCIFGRKFENKNNNTFWKTISSERTGNSDQSVFKKILKILSNDELRDKKDAISRVIKARPFRSTLMHWIVAFGCYEFFQYAWRKMTTFDRNCILGRDYIFIPSVKSFLPLAVLGGNLDIVKELIRYGADVNCSSEFKETSLDIAVKSDRYDMASLLMRNGAQGNLRGLFAMKIPIAITSKKQEFTSLILENDLNQTELHEAVRHNDLENLKSNIRSENIDSKTKSGWTVLHYAVLSNNLDAVKVLFHEELFQNNLSNVDLTHDDQRKLLYKAPTPKISIADNNGLTAVHLAVINNNIEILCLLLRYCVVSEVKVCDFFNRTPLHYTASKSATEKLLTRTSRNQYEKTLISVIKTIMLNITMQSPFRNICRDFVNMQDKKGNTPLHSVIKRRLLKEQSCECIETLLETGANPYLFNHSGTSALDLIKSSSCDTVQYINNSARYEQSIKKTYKVFAVVMLFFMVVTFGLATYIFSVTKKESQNAFCVGPVAESGNITLIQVTKRSTNVTLLIMVLPWLLLQFYNRNSHLRLQCMFVASVLILWGSFILLSAFVYIRNTYMATSGMLVTVFLYMEMMQILSHYINNVSLGRLDKWFINYFFPIFLLCICLCCIVSFIFNAAFSIYPKSDNLFSTSNINTLNITTSNCTEFSSVNISCTSLAYNITYKHGSDFSVQCFTDPNITSYNNTHGTLTVESEFIYWSEISIMSLFCLNFSLHTTSAYCFIQCIITLINRLRVKEELYTVLYIYLFSIIIIQLCVQI